MNQRTSSRRRWATLLCAIGLVFTAAPSAGAEPPPEPPPDPYPKTDLFLNVYTRVDPAEYFMPNVYGVYFLTTTGLNCGIFVRGSFGCMGAIPGAPPGSDRIGWFNGDTEVHYDFTVGINWPPVQAVQVLPPQSSITWNETTCVAMANTDTYCKRGGFRFLITANGTWLNG